ncbi:hypothetical protein HPB52_011728 [Rhipicephalus sanguineus]|uniref:Tick transposon n=2 Tax=Rhipicephalus sanguineus TaxID=34632 RepID=A0A9D4PNZ3_RHISA|nr:hypothetical protein HPB52_011728 [Rhipicephalus sanguineus]
MTNPAGPRSTKVRLGPNVIGVHLTDTVTPSKGRRQDPPGAPSQPAKVTDGRSLSTLPPDGPAPASSGCPSAAPSPATRGPPVPMVGATKRCTPAAALQQAAASKLQEQLEGRLQVFTYGSVMPDGTAAAACVIPSKAISRQCRLPFPASSTAAELAGLHLAADLLTEDIPAVPIAVLCDGKAALQTLANHRRAGLTGNLLETKFRVLTASGASPSTGCPLTSA